jgi:ribose transport system substrate-binding protein
MKPPKHYYLVASNIKLPYWQAALAGLRRGAGDLKVKADMVGPDTYDPAEQRNMFRYIVSKKPAGIMVSAADPVLMKSEINAAIAAGIPVITIDSDAPGSQRLFFIGTNNYQAGIAGGQVLVQRLNRKGNVVVLTIPAQANLVERMRGYEAAVAGTDIKFVQTVDIHGDPAQAFDKTMEIITSGKTDGRRVCVPRGHGGKGGGRRPVAARDQGKSNRSHGYGRRHARLDRKGQYRRDCRAEALHDGVLRLANARRPTPHHAGEA